MAEHQKTDPVMPLTLLVCIILVCFGFVAGMSEALAQNPSIAALTRQQPVVQVNRLNSSLESRRAEQQRWVNRKSHAISGGRIDSVLEGSLNSQGGFGDRMYIIQPHDQPALLALETTGSSANWPDIANYNNLDESRGLEAGQLLYIPQHLINSNPTAVSTNRAASSSQPLIYQQDDDLINNPVNTISPERAITKAALPGLSSNPGSVNNTRNSDAELLAMAIDQQQGVLAPESSMTVSSGAIMTALLSENPEGGVDSEVNPLVDITADTASRKVDMFAGEARVLGRVAVDKVAVGNGSIIRAEVLDNGELLVIAQTEGSSSLHLWHKDDSHSSFNIRVSASDPEIRVRLDKTIRMRVKMIEFRKSALERMGIDWGDSIDGPLFATVGDAATNSLFRPSQQESLGDSSPLPLAIKPFSSYFGIATQLSSRINLLVNKGDAEMLAEPVLSCSNGGTARFLAGGEVPFPTVGSNGQTTINFREYGIRLEISPRVDEFNNIQADIMTEVSSIDSSVSVMGAPGLLTRRTQTQVSTSAGSTIVIAGLMQLEQGRDKDSLPGLGRLPVLGKLFSSDSSNRTVSELVIFITPEVVEPGNRGISSAEDETHQYVLNELQKARQQLKQFRGQ